MSVDSWERCMCVCVCVCVCMCACVCMLPSVVDQESVCMGGPHDCVCHMTVWAA